MRGQSGWDLSLDRLSKCCLQLDKVDRRKRIISNLESAPLISQHAHPWICCTESEGSFTERVNAFDEHAPACMTLLLMAKNTSPRLQEHASVALSGVLEVFDVRMGKEVK